LRATPNNFEGTRLTPSGPLPKDLPLVLSIAFSEAFKNTKVNIQIRGDFCRRNQSASLQVVSSVRASITECGRSVRCRTPYKILFRSLDVAVRNERPPAHKNPLISGNCQCR